MMQSTALALALASAAFGQSLIEVLSGSPQLSSISSLLQPYASSFSDLTNITLLAPDNNAISIFLNSSTGAAVVTQPDLFQAILSYHVLQGSYSNITNTSFIPTSLEAPTYANVTGGQVVHALVLGSNVTIFSGLLQDSSVVNASIPFDQGTIQTIDRFLTIPQNISATAVALNLTSVVGAIQALNLTKTIDYTEDLTVFLPNNAAFQRIGGNLANLSTEELAKILSYHVVPGAVLYSTDITNGSTIATLNEGGNITVTQESSGVYINDARVVLPNVLVANGVIHVIDQVLNPANATAAVVPNIGSTSGKGMSTGAKAGIGVGVAISVLLAFTTGCWLFLKKRRQRRAPELRSDEYIGKPELEASNEKDPISRVAELSASKRLRETAQRDIELHTEQHELPGSDSKSAQAPNSRELDSRHLHEVSGITEAELPDWSAKNSSKAATGVETGPVRQISDPKAIAPAVDEYSGAPTTIEDLELQYLENEERRIQTRKAELLRERENQS